MRRAFHNKGVGTANCESRYACTACYDINMSLSTPRAAKGQLISKCLFGAIVSTKKPTNFNLRISAIPSKKRSNQKNKSTLLYLLVAI